MRERKRVTVANAEVVGMDMEKTEGGLRIDIKCRIGSDRAEFGRTSSHQPASNYYRFSIREKNQQTQHINRKNKTNTQK